MNIFFDLDGVLVDPYPRYYKIHTLLANKYSFKPLSYIDYVKSKQNRLPELFYLKDSEKENYIQERLSLLEDPEFLSLDPLYPDVKKTLKILKNKHKLFLITIRRSKRELLRQLKNLGLIDYFNKVLSPKDGKFTKSLLEVKKELLQSFFQKNKSKTLIVGDTEVDILTGKYYSMITVAIPDRFRTKEFILSLKPDFTIRQIGELIPIVDSIISS